MATPRETRSGYARSSASSTLQGPPRSSASASRDLTKSAVEAARRQREREAVVLAQIVARAARLRVRADGRAASLSLDEPPLTLIALIQASTAVFEKHGIRAPEDATYHRHLLTLSLDPERDWKKKIQRFALKQAPRASRTTNGPTAGAAVFSPRANSIGSTGKTAHRLASIATSEVGFQTPSRRPSGVGAEPRSAGWIPPGVASRPPSRQGKRQSMDQFGDMLAAATGAQPHTPKETMLKENQLRNSIKADASTATEDEVVKAKAETPAQKLYDLEAIRAKLQEISGELTVEGEADEANDDNEGGDDDGGDNDGASSYVSRSIDIQDDDDATYSESISTSVQSIPPHAYYPSPAKPPSTAEEDSDYFEPLHQIDSPVEETRESIRTRFPADSFRRLAMSFQEWKEITTFHRLVRDGQQREMRLTQSVLPPVATFAIFRWIVMTLPARQDRLYSQSNLAVPMCVELRDIAVSNPPLLRHFTGRLLVWSIHRIFKTWACSARAIKAQRIKSLIRARTQVLHTAFACLQQWHKLVRRRRRTNDHGLWVEALHTRRCLRRTMRVWRDELKTRRQEHDMTQVYRRRRLSAILKRWRTWTKRCRVARDHGSRRLLRRLFRAWRHTILWSEQEQAQIARARAQYARRILKRCWSSWRGQTSLLKVKRLQTAKATKCFYTKIRRRIWVAWRGSHSTRKFLAQKCARFKKRRQAQILRSILLGWSGHTHRKKCSTLTVMDACARRDDRLLKRVWDAWIAHFTLSIEADDAHTNTWKRNQTRQIWIAWKRKASLLRLSTTVKACFDSSATRIAFSKWRTWVQKQRYYLSLVGDWRGEKDDLTKQRVFDALHENVKIGRVKVQAVQGFLNRCEDTRLQSYIAAWRELSRSRRASRRHDELRVEAWNGIHLRRCWATWRHAFHIARCVQIAYVAMTQSVRRRHFQLWRSAIQTRHALRASTKQFHRCQLTRAVRMWCCRVEANRTDQSVTATLAAHRNKFLLQRGLRVWRDLFAAANQRHTKAARAVLRWQNKRVQLFFLEWQAIHVKRIQLQALLTAWREGTKGKSLQSRWRAWQEYIVLKHDKKTISADAHQHYKQRSLKRAIQKWRFRSEHSRERVLVMQKCVTHWGGNQRRRLFMRWKQFAHLRHLLRAMNSRNSSKLVQRCFANWCKWKHRRDITALELEDLTSRLCQSTMRRAVRRLRQHAVASKRLASLQDLVKLAGSRGLQTASFRRWVTFNMARNLLKRDRKANADHMERFRQQLSVKRWEKRTRLKKLVASTLTHTKTQKTRETVARVFSRWRQHVVERKLFNALKEKAHVFQALSMLPTYFYAWRQYIEAQRRNQQLVLNATRLMCHQCESRAFKSWRRFTNRTKQTRNALRLWRNQSMLSRLARWRQFVGQEKAKTRAIIHYEATARKRIVREWREAAHRQRLLKHFTQVWHAQTTEQCFRRWAKHTKAIKCTRTLLRRLQQTSLTRVFNSWKVFIEKHQEIQGNIQQRFALLWNQDRKMTGFQRWKALVAQQKMLKRRMLQRMTKQIARFFSRWRSAIVRRKSAAERGVTVRRNQTHRLLATFWMNWKRRKVIHDAVNALRRRVMSQSSDVFVQILLQEWMKVTRKAVVAKKARIEMGRRMMALIFTGWRDRFVVRRRAERTIAHEIRKHDELRIVKSVILRMRARMTIKNTCTRVFLPQLQRHLVAEAWRSWVLYHVGKQQTKERIHRVHHSMVTSHHSVKFVALASVSRWHALHQAQCFDHWYTIAGQLKWMRSHTAMAIQMWQTRLSASSFRSWRNWGTHHKRKRAVETSSAKHHQARAWSLWMNFHRDHQLQRFLTGRAANFHRKRVLAAVTSAWRAMLARRRHHALLAASLTLHRTQRSLRKWRCLAVHTRSLRVQFTVATVAAHHKRISVCWYQWKQFVVSVQMHRRELQQHTERLEVLILCSTFRAWRAWSQRQSKINRVLALLSSRCDAKTARRILYTWASYAQAKKLQQDMVVRFTRETYVRKGIQALQYHVQQQIAEREVTRKARQWVEILQGRFVRRSFQSWQRVARLAKKARHVIQRYNTSKLLPNTFNAWKEFVELRKNKNHHLERAVTCWRSVFARRAWNAWLDHHKRRQAVHFALIKARDHFTLQLLRRALDDWRSKTVKKQVTNEGCRKMLVRWKMQTAYRSFARWQSHSLRRKAICVSSAIVSSRFANIQLREGWGEWRRQFVVNRVGMRKRLARAFDRWQQRRCQRRDWHQFQAVQSQTLLQNVRGRRGIKLWREFVVRAKMGKTMALLSSRFSKDTLVKGCFEKWLQYLVIRHREKEKMKRVVVWIRNRQLMSCFQALALYTRGQQQKKAQHKIAIAHAQQHTVRSVFMEWEKAVSVAQEQRQKLRRYVDVMQHLSQRKSFIAWRDYALKRVQLKATCASLLSQRTMFTTHTLFEQWTSFAIKMKRRKKAEAFNCRRLCQETLRQWGKFVILTRIERMLGASEQRILERCFLGWRKRTVIHTTVWQLSREKRERDRKEILKSHLLAWHSWTRIQAKCSSLLANVALGHNLRFRFLMWKKYAEKAKRLKRLVMGAGTLSPVADGIVQGVVNAGEGVPTITMEQRPAVRLARMARFFQQFQIEWDDKASVWQRWRHAFHACLFYRIRRLYKIFSTWQTWSRRRSFVRSICLSRHRTREFVLRKTVLLQWHDVVTTVKQIHRERQRERELLVIVNAQMLRQDRKVLQRHWTAWRERTENKKHLLVSVDSYQRARLLTKFWLLWSHDFVNAMKQEHQLQAKRCGQLAAVKARRVIRCLLDARSRGIRARHAIVTLQKARQGRWLRKVFDGWKRRADTSRRARLLALFQKRQVMRRAYQAWCTWLEARYQQACAINEFVCRRTEQRRTDMFRRWSTYIQYRRQREDATALATNFHLQRYLRSRWLRAVQTWKLARQMAEQPCEALIKWRQRRTVTRWRNAVRRGRLLRNLKTFVQRKHFEAWKRHVHELLADRFCGRLHRKRTKSIFDSWKFEASRRQRLRCINNQLICAREEQLERHVWKEWMVFADRGRKLRIAREHSSHVLKLKSLLYWYDATRVTMAERAERLIVAGEFQAYSKKRTVLRRWVSALVQARQRRAVLLVCVFKIQRAFLERVQQVVLHAWCDAADLQRFSRECERILQQQRAVRAIRNWRRQIHERRRLDQLQRDTAIYRRSRLLSQVFFHWQNYALAWKDAAAARQRKSTHTSRTKAITPHLPSPPPPPVDTNQEADASDEEDTLSLRFRRPLSPMKKRMRAATLHRSLDLLDETSPPMPSFADAATLSLDVKKRLLVLGMWKPTHKSLSHV